MNNSIKLAFVAAIAAAGIAACTSAPAQEQNAAPQTSAPAGTSTPPSVVTQTVTSTVTNPPKPQAVKSGYGALKLGMTLDEAKATGLTGPGITVFGDSQCVWNERVEISQKNGVESIELPKDAKTSAGIGVGSTFAEVKRAYPNAQEFDGGYKATLPDGGGIAFYTLVAKPFKDADAVSGMRIYSTGNVVCPHVTGI